ncbi:MAG: aminoacyl-tRNA hydrolase, partial [Candidatus Yonathbacteria bacterium]|nr:aminoacyl-tRNA hydrolase [Candidatus Yonathbacteria bacterium]
MKLIIGLGNPGEEYIGTRHNVGREVVRGLSKDWKVEKKLFAEIAKHNDIIFALPTTYMNESGQPVQLLVTRYALRVTDLVIIHDDIDLPLGTIRISKNASAGGHNGVQSIIDALGTKEFTRLRIGVAGIAR